MKSWVTRNAVRQIRNAGGKIDNKNNRRLEWLDCIHVAGFQEQVHLEDLRLWTYCWGLLRYKLKCLHLLSVYASVHTLYILCRTSRQWRFMLWCSMLMTQRRIKSDTEDSEIYTYVYFHSKGCRILRWFISFCYNKIKTNTCPSNTFCMISGFRRHVNDICALVGCYAACFGNSLLAFRDNGSVPKRRKGITTTYRVTT